MKRTRIIKLNTTFKILLENSGFIALFITYLISFIIGCICVFKNENLLNYISTEFKTFYNIRSSGNFGTILLNSLLFAMPCVLLSFACGTSVVGCAISPICLIYKGFIFGTYSGYIYEMYELEGIVFNALIFMPSAITSVFALILSVKESVAFSAILAKMCIKGKKNISLFTDFKGYCYKHLVILCILIVAVILDLGCSTLFIKFFKF